MTAWIFSLAVGPLPDGRGSDRSHDRKGVVLERHKTTWSQYYAGTGMPENIRATRISSAAYFGTGLSLVSISMET